jgi:RHH-type proline utilization regulon transcriptional repressor/proline dehydrogenase/delta 1-pyrroline-5-carboxylate dehydrogenase
VVGTQPFGGEGLSGTGPKAGGPHYLQRFLKPARLDPETEFSGAPVGPEHEALPDEGDWAERHDRVSVLRKALRGKATGAVAAVAALDFGPVDLPGPTGEANTLALAPRGAALCLGPTAGAVLDQAVVALGCGNAVVAVAEGAKAALKPLIGQGLPFVAFDGQPTEALLVDGPFDVVMSGGSDAALRFVRRALARRSGPIVPLVVSLDAAALCVERTVSVDTTAAGGNASLLAAAG